MLDVILLALKGLGVLVLGVVVLQLVLSLDLIKRWQLRHLPGPPALPLLGNLPQIIAKGSPAFFRECRAKYGPVFRVAFGRSWMVVVAEPDLLRQVGGKLLNHSMFRTLLGGEFAQLDEWGLVSARDEFWRQVRAAWQPAFSGPSLSGYFPLMAGCAARLADKLERLALQAQGQGQGGQVAGEQAAAGNEGQLAAGAAAGGRAGSEPARVDIWRELGAMTLQVVGSTAYGVDFQAMEPLPATTTTTSANTTGGGDNEKPAAPSSSSPSSSSYGRVLVEACRDVFKYSSVVYGSKYSRVGLLLPEWRPAVSVLAHAAPDPPFTKILTARTHLRDACMSLINAWKQQDGTGGAQEKQKEKKEGKENGAAAKGHANGAAAVNDAAAAGAAAGVAPGSFLGLVLAARDKSTGEGLTDLQVAAQVQTFILAGYETTANALAFAVYCIATNPEAEAKLLAEIDSVLGPDRLPTEADLPRLPYTEAVFNEALRLFPPAHATNRHTDKGPMQVGPYTVPKGFSVFMSIFSAHHNEDVWPRVDDFVPERFLPESPLYPEVAARVPHAHSPFGFGSRMCIGWKFAVQEAKVALATIYQRLTFELEPGQVPLKTAVGITLSPRNGVWVRPVARRPVPRRVVAAETEAEAAK
ncbi:hypothetical protein HYH02_009670 [Chlamydomonas schloesseri]|uniref:Cytochrome P450 n=1 Tax=Chlamydomonas schloesseri TaxID=2026947 RepID=A0A835W6B4_9CHLO|nr:hypothetical protein HYH02_009670 [Chlamydomonas schloesseri]|eukprot:KAG2442182.1 hypothetical protein HYH02_009670 [Chlamydomonas schloesseri]